MFHLLSLIWGDKSPAHLAGPPKASPSLARECDGAAEAARLHELLLPPRQDLPQARVVHVVAVDPLQRLQYRGCSTVFKNK